MQVIAHLSFRGEDEQDKESLLVLRDNYGHIILASNVLFFCLKNFLKFI